VKASAETVEWLRAYYAALDALRFDEVAGFLDEDCTCVYPNGHVQRGPERIMSSTRRALESLAAIRHEVRGAWEEAEELIFELNVTYTRRDGQTIVRPGVGIFTLKDGKIREQRLFVDASGVWD